MGTLYLKQSTAITISFGPAVLNSDGVTYVTNLVGTGANQTENTSTGIRISKNGAALAARHATAGTSVYDAFGQYLVILDTTDTNTLGTLRMIYGNAAAFCPIFQDFMVLPANMWNSLFGTGGSIPDAVAGAAGGVFIAGTNAATTVTTSFTTTFTGNLTGSVASVTGAVGSVTGAVGSVTGITASDVGAIKTTTDKFVFTVANQVDSNVITKTGFVLSAVGSAALTESYAADGAAPTLNQAIYQLWSFLAEANLSGTTITAKKLDGATTAMTFTVDSATAPTTITRAT